MLDTSSLHAGIALERRGLRDRVYELVLSALMSPEIEPGSRLSIDTVARDLNVSPTPVREALVLLERTGLVTREANKGYRVAPPISDGQLEALFDARIVLESGVVELAAAHTATVVPLLEDALAAHREITEKVKQAASESDISVALLQTYFEVDWKFHHVIFESAQNPFLLDMSDAISTRVHRMRQTVQSGTSDADQAVVEHAAILDAFREGDAHSAVAAMRSHIEKVRIRSRSDSHLDAPHHSA
ncbi:GntR family transcriptional regulator [Parafrigoribacterium soli]|uniref:GntR family transcriptional regulator n=1 Tax=Parafrigoribacterium soli TaxID=3144663 RepID=UPI0032ED287C